MLIEHPSVTLEEFLSLPETEPASEYQDGVITRKPEPQGKHSTLQGAWTSWIQRQTALPRLGMAFPELRCTFAGRSIVPDIAYVAWERIPVDANGNVGDEFFLAPDLAIEIVSPEQSLRSLQEKLTACVRNGVQLGLLVDPYGETITSFRADRAAEVASGGPLSLAPVLPALELTVETVWGWLKLR